MSEPGAVEDPLIGQRFGEDGCYVVELKLGEGGMGAVYRALDEKHQRPVALKFLRSDTSDRDAVERFKREGRKFGRLRHPNLVQVYALGREKGRLYIASEFVAGRNLYSILAVDGALAVESALRIARAAAAGLVEAHKNLVIHRDLKPENIMVRDADRVVKVLDFGIAKDLDASVALTKQGTYIGTPAYSAPEQVKGEGIDHRADIFSLGVILYELLTGRVAFQGRHTVEVLKATLKDEPVPAQRLNDSVSAPVARLIDAMIQKSPRRRPESMESVVREIDLILDAIARGISEEEGRGVRAFLKRVFEGWRGAGGVV
jgi:serine/threonine protein kinase